LNGKWKTASTQRHFFMIVEIKTIGVNIHLQNMSPAYTFEKLEAGFLRYNFEQP